MSFRIESILFAIFVLFMPARMSPYIYADTITWDGTCGNNLWDATCFAGVANNWQPNTLPAASDDAVIPDGFGVIVFNVTSQAVNSITVNGTSGLRIDGSRLDSRIWCTIELVREVMVDVVGEYILQGSVDSCHRVGVAGRTPDGGGRRKSLLSIRRDRQGW